MYTETTEDVFHVKWTLSWSGAFQHVNLLPSLPTKISQQIPRNSPHRWWILSASIGSPVLIKVPWVDDFAGKNTGKWWWKAERIREVRFFFLVEMVCSTLQWKTEYECIYIYIRFKVERCFSFPIWHVSSQGKSHGVFGVAIMVSSKNVLYSFLVRKGVKPQKAREEALGGSKLTFGQKVWLEDVGSGDWGNILDSK